MFVISNNNYKNTYIACWEIVLYNYHHNKYYNEL